MFLLVYHVPVLSGLGLLLTVLVTDGCVLYWFRWSCSPRAKAIKLGDPRPPHETPRSPLTCPPGVPRGF